MAIGERVDFMGRAAGKTEKNDERNSKSNSMKNMQVKKV